MAQLSGVAPVIERSGQTCRVRWRYLCPKLLRQSFHKYAGESIKHSFWARAYYAEQGKWREMSDSDSRRE
ncbi:MAG: hypothetical protein H0W76_21655 [Pyrinomonadaceae bacterium]|nr:hypothetical protein [Pyrinomonadaceae bacterium]